GFQDIYSGKILSWRVDISENWDLVRLAFADMVETYGVPDHVLFDNGRAFASKKITGGTPNRFRFKVKAEEPEGIITALGCQIHWATPYHGQAKPIERAWRDLAHNISRDVRFEGAYTGGSVDAKPENYGSRAVPFDVFMQVVSEGILEHNARLGRRSKVCGGNLSFDQAFAASYETAIITRPHEAQLRKLLLSSELVSVRKTDGSVELAGNRYWSEFLINEIGRKVTLRFDPDALQEPVHIYRPDGAYLGAAPCVEAVGFFSTEAARIHARARADFIKKSKEAALAAQKLTLAEQAALLPKVEAPEAPETKVVRPFIATRGNAAVALTPANSVDPEDSFWTDFNRSASRLRVVRNEDGAGD
ncbi:transposase domain-containing protein, partial [Starkeya nomas]|uniref:transposase domain-containing protein n=1 Tax=Starkeya nomas TaxID=2666134 RepID=UPI00190F891F